MRIMRAKICIYEKKIVPLQQILLRQMKETQIDTI